MGWWWLGFQGRSERCDYLLAYLCFACGVERIIGGFVSGAHL